MPRQARARMSWSRTPRDLIIILAVTLVVACSAEGGSEANASDDAALAGAMQKFVIALRDKDIEGFADLFPRQSRWTYIGTITDPVQTSEYSHGALLNDLRQQTGLYESLYDADGDDTFRDYVMMTDGKPWIRSGENRFSPPGLPDMATSVFVRWRREGQRWVVDAIAEPAS